MNRTLELDILLKIFVLLIIRSYYFTNYKSDTATRVLQRTAQILQQIPIIDFKFIKIRMKANISIGIIQYPRIHTVEKKSICFVYFKLPNSLNLIKNRFQLKI